MKVAELDWYPSSRSPRLVEAARQWMLVRQILYAVAYRQDPPFPGLSTLISGLGIHYYGDRARYLG